MFTMYLNTCYNHLYRFCVHVNIFAIIGLKHMIRNGDSENQTPQISTGLEDMNVADPPLSHGINLSIYVCSKSFCTFLIQILLFFKGLKRRFTTKTNVHFHAKLSETPLSTCTLVCSMESLLFIAYIC